MIDFSFKGHYWSFERKSFKLEFDDEMTALERSLLRTGDVDFPDTVAFVFNDIVSKINLCFTRFQAVASLC